MIKELVLAATLAAAAVIREDRPLSGLPIPLEHEIFAEVVSGRRGIMLFPTEWGSYPKGSTIDFTSPEEYRARVRVTGSRLTEGFREVFFRLEP